MKESVLKAIIAKAMSKKYAYRYCHIERIIKELPNKAVVAAVVHAPNMRKAYWIVVADWETNDYGIHSITNLDLMEELEYHGTDPYEQCLVQEPS